ncbi:substrate-binding periplasmic protein [Paucibacter soli]|uniref:substrate-binding periplasmic protein n=1 Tax=Paucibacter soli TaxID=3133433 RepID=UPI0030AE016D
MAGSWAAACALTVVVGFGTPAQAQPPAKRLDFVTEPYAPYTYERDGRAAGPMMDVLQATCARLQWQCQVQVLPWRRAYGMAERGLVDGIFTLLETPERRALFRFSIPVIEARFALFARSGQDFVYTGPVSLIGHEIGVYGPSGSSASLAELVQGLDVKTQLEPDNTTVLRKLVAGRYGEQGLAFMNESVALWLLKAEKLPGLQMAGVAKQFAYPFGLVRSRVTAAEAAAFDAALLANCRSGVTAALLRPYALPAAPCGAPH